jgi:hypothetical protein
MRRSAALAAVLALLLGGVGLAPAGARAATATTFGPATAKATFEVGIDLTETATLPAAVTRVEILVRTGSNDTSSVADVVPTPAAGPATLHYQLPLVAGAMVPNTLVRLQFRVTLADGSREDGPIASVRYQDTRFTWKTLPDLPGSIVRVHWIDGTDDFGKRARTIGEKAIADASKLLGVTETEPIDFYIYSDTAAFRDVLGPGTRENVGGVAFPDIRTLFANIGPGSVDDPWVGIVIPHELTHLVFDTATQNPYHGPPHWLNEGLAVYLSQGYDSSDRGSVADAVRSGSLMPLPALTGQFPTTADRFGLAYAESVSSIDFMVRRYGKPALVQLIRSYHDGRTDDEAFDAALGVDVAGFEAAWVADLGATEPTAAGPQPAPAGPVPPGWEGAGATPGTVPGASPPTSPGTPDGSSVSGLLATGIATALVAFLGIGLLAVAMRRRRRQPPPVE